jgi:hypothetical protein
MSETLSYPGFGTGARTSTHALFAQTMGVRRRSRSAFSRSAQYSATSIPARLM